MKLRLIDHGKHYEPKRAHWNDSGMDVFTPVDFTLAPNERSTIPLNLGLEIPNGFEIQVRPKSSFNARGILTQFGTVDAGYTGNIAVVLVNLTNNPIEFKEGQKIAQLVLAPVTYFSIDNKEEEARGEGGFGSTGEK